MTLTGWFWEGSGINWPRVLLVALGCAVLVGLGIVGSTSAVSFGPYNPAWDGASDLREQIDADPNVSHELISETRPYEEVDPETTVAFVVAPDEPYEGEDLDRVNEFVQGGGTLVYLDNFGANRNELLAALGTEARLDGDIIRDEQHYYRGPLMPIATGIENHTLTDGVDQLTLNYATAVQPGNATVLVRTSEFAYLVEDSDEEIGDDDELTSYPVATVEASGNGNVIVVGDPSITINAMRTQPDNEAFLTRLYSQEGTERALVDISHTSGLPPLTSAVLTLRGSPPLQMLLGGVGIIGFSLLSGRRLRPVLRRVSGRLGRWTRSDAGGISERGVTPKMSDADRARYLRQRYPDWDEKRVARVIKALNSPDSKEGDRRTDE